MVDKSDFAVIQKQHVRQKTRTTHKAYTSEPLFLKKKKSKLVIQIKEICDKDGYIRRGWESFKGLYRVISNLFPALYSFIGREQNADGCYGRRT